MVRNPYAVLAVACATIFMAVVDFTIVAVSLPQMAADLHLSEAALQWVFTAYGLPFGGLLLLAGRLGDILGRRRMLRIGLTIFGLSSLIAGLATDGAQLIGARFGQGVGAALMSPSALGLVGDAFGQGDARDKALGAYGATQAAAATAGVLGGGLLTDGPGWSWIFYVNIPIVVMILLGTFLVLPTNRIAEPGGRFDPRSSVAVVGGLVAGLYALSRGAEYGWSSTGALVFAAVSVVLLLAFVASEWSTRIPLVPRVLLRNPPVVQTNLATFASFGSFIAFIYLTSVTMQQLLGFSATKTGVAWLLTTVTAFIFAGLTGAVLSKKVPIRILLGIAGVLIVISGALLVSLPEHASFAKDVLPSLILAGVAVGLIAPSVGIGALMGVSEDKFGAASGLVETSREFGAAVVIASVSSALLSAQTSVMNGSQTSLVHGTHVAYAVVAVGAALGVLPTLVRARPRLEVPTFAEMLRDSTPQVEAPSPAVPVNEFEGGLPWRGSSSGQRGSGRSE